MNSVQGKKMSEHVQLFLYLIMPLAAELAPFYPLGRHGYREVCPIINQTHALSSP
jgi:hypothetical protein